MDITLSNAYTISQSGEITGELFGANILADRYDTVSSAYTNAANELGASTIRWPGGSLTEDNGMDLLADPDSVAGRGLGFVGLTEFINWAAEESRDVALVIPTRQGFSKDHATALSDGSFGNRQVSQNYINDAVDFVLDALAKATAEGVTIKSLEIGNEFWGSGRMTATEYGRLVGELAPALDQALSQAGYSGDARPEILMQSTAAAGQYSPNGNGSVTIDGVSYNVPGQGSVYQQILDIAAEVNAANAADSVDGLLIHYYARSQGFDAAEAQNLNINGAYDVLANQLGRNDGSLSWHVSEWNVWNSLPFDGLQQASILIDMMFEMAEHGVDSAQVWPIEQNNTNRLLSPDGDLSFGGEAFLMMQQALVGSKAFYDRDYGDAEVNGFKSDEKITLFISSHSASSQTITLDYGSLFAQQGFDDIGHIWATELATSTPGNPTNHNADPIVTIHNQSDLISGTNEISINLDAYETFKIEFTLQGKGANIFGRGEDDTLIGSNANDTLVGGEGNDIIRGAKGNDTIFGGDGADTLRAGKGDDEIFGGAGDDLFRGNAGQDALYGGEGADKMFAGGGNDTLFGGAGDDKLGGNKGDDWLSGKEGNDILDGGDGSDSFIFARGDDADVIRDFEDNVDTIRFSGFGSRSEVLSYGANQGSNAFFDFGAGDTLLIQNITLAQLSDDLIFV